MLVIRIIICVIHSYIDDDPFTEVVIVRNWMEVVLPGVLGVLVDALLLMPADFWQRSTKNKN